MTKKIGKCFPYENNLFGDSNSVDIILPVLAEDSIGHHGLWFVILIQIVHLDDQRMVRANRFSQLESNEIVHVENALIWRDLLVNPRTDIYLAQIVGTVWRVEHFRSIIRILLLSNTEVYSHTCLAKRINLESNFDVISFMGHLERIFCQGAFNVEIFEFSIALGGLLLPALLVH